MSQPDKKHNTVRKASELLTNPSINYTATINMSNMSNQQADLNTHIQLAKQFLKENPDEQSVTAARIYDLKPTTLYSQLAREPTGTRGGQNRILQEHHVRAIHDFIRSLLTYQIQPTHTLVFNAICHLKRAQEPNNFKAPTLRWFRTWWKDSGLHKIKSKPLAIIRITAQQEEDVRRWFRKYTATLKQYKIMRKNILNFDEAGFRVGCAKGEEILVPLDIHEVCCLYSPTL